MGTNDNAINWMMQSASSFEAQIAAHVEALTGLLRAYRTFRGEAACVSQIEY